MVRLFGLGRGPDEAPSVLEERKAIDSYGAIDGHGIDEAWVLFAGWRQRPATITGTTRLRAALHDAIGSPRIVIDQWTWDEPVQPLADFYLEWAADRRLLRFNVWGHSLGGAAAVRFCEALDDRSHKVQRLILDDAKFLLHPRLPWPSYFDFRRYDFATLRVPRNVNNLWRYAQRGLRPRGSPIEYDPRFTKLRTTDDDLNLPDSHLEIDDNPYIHATILQEISHARPRAPDPSAD